MLDQARGTVGQTPRTERVGPMDRQFVRTCSSDQALVLAAAEGRLACVGTKRVRICRPAGRQPIVPNSSARYVARIELIELGPSASEADGSPTAEVVKA